MRANILILLPLLLTFALLASAQVTIEGQVTHDGSAIDLVTIQVFEHGKIQRTVAANKRGKYDLAFPYNHEYTLVFRRPYMIPVKIGVNTARPDDIQSNVVVNVPLNMELFMRFKDLDISGYKQPIGVVNRVGTGENSFDFVPDSDVLETVKQINAESTRKKKSGEKPIDSDDAEIVKNMADNFKDEAIEKNETAIAESSTTEVELEYEKVKPTLDLDSKELTTATARYDRIEDGANESNRQERTKQNQKNESIADVSSNQSDYIIDAKVDRNTREENKTQQATLVADARVKKQERVITGLTESSRSPTRITQRTSADQEPIKKETDEGTFVSEEFLSVNENGQVTRYRKVTYNWLLFEMDYYYKNDKEISENAYNEVRGLFN